MSPGATLWAARAVVTVGLLQMAGDLLGLQTLKGLAAASMLSPAPKVFSAVRGFETYSTRFFLEWDDGSGTRQAQEVDAELNARLRGPYNRRNIYGAALAYGPVLPAPLRDPVMRFALCGDAPLLRELGLEAARSGTHLRVHFVPRPGTTVDAALPLVLEAPCP